MAGNYFDRFHKPLQGPGGVDLTQPLPLEQLASPPPPPPPSAEAPGGNYFDRYDPETEDQKREKLRITKGQSWTAPPKKGLWDRFVGGASDMMEHYSPAAMAARWVARVVPLDRDYDEATAASRGTTAEALQAQRVQGVTDKEREWRELRAMEEMQDPAWRPDGSFLGNMTRMGSEFAGGMAGGMISDPTNLIAPGSTLLRKMGTTAAIGGGVDLALQGGEGVEGVRDEWSPLQTAISTAAGPAFIGGIHAARQIPGPRAIRDWWQNRGADVPEADLQFGPLDGGPPVDIARELAGAGYRPDQFSSPELAAAAAERVRAARDRVPPNDLGADELARQRAMRQAIEDGVTDPAFAPDVPPRTMPDDVPIIAAPEGAIRGDDPGAAVGVERKRAADQGVMGEAAAAARNDPVVAEILGSGLSPQAKLSTLFDRLERFGRETARDPNRFEPIPDRAPDLPPVAASRWQAPTPEAAGAERPGGDFAGMTRFIMDDLEGGGKPVTDTGGATRFGISQKGNPDVDIAGLDANSASKLYRDRYWKPMELDGLPRDLQLVAYDAAINHGPGRAKAMLAEANGSASRLLELRQKEYDRLVLQDPGKYAKFADGWKNRLDKLRGQVGADMRVASPDGETIGGQYSAASRVDRVPGEPQRGPVREDFQGFERTEQPASPTRGNLEEGEVYANRDGTTFSDDRRGRPFEARTQTGTSDRPFPVVGDDPAGQPGFWEGRARQQHEEAFRKAQDDLEAEWADRARANEERARRGGKTRFEEERVGSEDPSSAFGKKGYGQKPHKDADIWRTTDDGGFVADKDGRPVAFRNAREAAKWAAANKMGGDFELRSWATNSSRIVLKRREASTYGSRPAGPAEPPAGRSADASIRAIEAPGRAEAPEGPGTPGDPGSRAGGAPGEPTAPIRPSIPAETRAPVVGAAEQVRTARGRDVDTQLQVRELRDLISSDHPAYDPRLQPRDRAGRNTSDAQVAEIAARLDPEQLASSRLASQGAPIIGPDRLVESGNGRTQALRRAYEQHPDKVQAYQDMIRAKGFDLEGFEQPVLVRQRVGELADEDRLAFVREANERDTMSLSSTEQAKIDAGAMSDVTLSRYRGGGVTDAGNRDFVRAWMDEVATPAERNSLIQSDGSISTDGIRRLRASMLSKAFDDVDLVGKIVEDPDNGIRSIGNVLTDAAPEFAKLRQRTASGELAAEFDISKQIAEMAQLISRARSEGKSALDLVNQTDIFAGETNPTTAALVRMMFKGDEMRAPRSAADMAEGLRFYTTEAGKVTDSPGLLGDQAPKLSPADILQAATKKLDAKQAARSDKGASLFMRAREAGFGAGQRFKEPLADALARVSDYQQNRHIRELSGRLAELVGKQDVRYGQIDGGHRGSTNIFSDTAREPGGAEISSVKVRSPNDHETILHEAVHTATLARYGELVDGAMEGDAQARPIIQALEDLRGKAQSIFDRRPPEDAEARFWVERSLENTDEFLAYGLTSPTVQKWMQRHSASGLWGRFVDSVRSILGFEPKYGSLLDNVLTQGARLLEDARGRPAKGSSSAAGGEKSFRMASTPEPGDAPARPTRAGFSKLVDSVLDVDGVKGDAGAIRAAIGKPTSTLRAFTRPMKRVVSAAMFTNDARVRGLAARFQSKAITDYADLWHARAGTDDGTGRTYHEAVNRAATTRTQRMYEALEPLLRNKDALGRVRDLLAHPTKSTRATADERAAAGELRALLKETLEYRKDAGEDIGEVSDGYFPRVLKVDQVAKKRDEFLKAAEQLYRSVGADNPAEAARRWFGQVFDEYAGLDGGLGFIRSAAGGSGSSSAKSREFGKQADALLRDFYEDDVFQVLASYFTGAAKRAEYARRFGRPGREGSTERQAWLKEHGDKSQFDVLMGRIKEDVRKSDEEPEGVLQVLDSVHRSNLGQMGSQDPFARNSVSALHTWNQLAKMDRVLITSLGELTMGFIRGGPRHGFPFLKDSLTEFARQVRRAEPSDAYRWAEAVGVVQDAVVNQSLTSREVTGELNVGAQRILAGYYKAIGLHQFTEGERTASVKMGRKLLDIWAHDLQSPTARVRNRAELYLRELGVQDPAAFGARLRDKPFTRDEVLADKGEAAEYGTALLRFVNQSVMMPTRAEKPTWAAHPVGSMIFSLMGYSYGFKKNVLDRGARLAVRGVKDHDPKLLVPAFSLSIMAAVQGLNDTFLRPFLFGSNYDFESETPTEMMVRVADRSGFTGGLSPIVNAVKAVKYDRSLIESLSGPVIGSVANAGQKVFVEPFTERNSPNTNTAERNAAAALYDTVLEPMLDGFAAARLKGLARSGAIYGTGNKEGGVLPGDKDAFIDGVAGEDESEDEEE